MSHLSKLYGKPHSMKLSGKVIPDQIEIAMAHSQNPYL